MRLFFPKWIILLWQGSQPVSSTSICDRSRHSLLHVFFRAKRQFKYQPEAIDRLSFIFLNFITFMSELEANKLLNHCGPDPTSNAYHWWIIWQFTWFADLTFTYFYDMFFPPEFHSIASPKMPWIRFQRFCLPASLQGVWQVLNRSEWVMMRNASGIVAKANAKI